MSPSEYASAMRRIQAANRLIAEASAGLNHIGGVNKMVSAPQQKEQP